MHQLIFQSAASAAVVACLPSLFQRDIDEMELLGGKTSPVLRIQSPTRLDPVRRLGATDRMESEWIASMCGEARSSDVDLRPPQQSTGAVFWAATADFSLGETAGGGSNSGQGFPVYADFF